MRPRPAGPARAGPGRSRGRPGARWARDLDGEVEGGAPAVVEPALAGPLRLAAAALAALAEVPAGGGEGAGGGGVAAEDGPGERQPAPAVAQVGRRAGAEQEPERAGPAGGGGVVHGAPLVGVPRVAQRGGGGGGALAVRAGGCSAGGGGGEEGGERGGVAGGGGAVGGVGVRAVDGVELRATAGPETLHSHLWFFMIRGLLYNIMVFMI
jgi:hypothetical protein